MTVETTAEKLLAEIRATLEAGGIDGARTESRIIVEHALRANYTAIISGTCDPVTDSSRQLAQGITKLRLTRKPLAYCIGSWNFYGLEYELADGVLVPRQDTETLVDYALDIIRSENFNSTGILDLYSGVGTILIAIAANTRLENGTGIEIDPVAHNLAVKNSSRHNLEHLEFRNADVLSEVGSLINENRKFHMVTANPPYVPSPVISTLQPEISGFENPVTLDGGPDGLDHFRFLAENAGDVLKPNGFLLVEIGFDQNTDVLEIFKSWSSTQVKPDLNGIQRILVAQL